MEESLANPDTIFFAKERGEKKKEAQFGTAEELVYPTLWELRMFNSSVFTLNNFISRLPVSQMREGNIHIETQTYRL